MLLLLLRLRLRLRLRLLLVSLTLELLLRPTGESDGTGSRAGARSRRVRGGRVTQVDARTRGVDFGERTRRVCARRSARVWRGRRANFVAVSGRRRWRRCNWVRRS